MSGSITDSDACGNDWDNTWIPPTGSGAEPSNLPFCWKSPWKKVDVILVDHSGQREIIPDETGCFVPVKFQYLITNRLRQLQTLIHNIQSLDVKSIQTRDELLEITTKTDVHLGAGSEIETVLLNELEDIYLKAIQRFPFTCSIAEELFKGQIGIMLIRDESRVYVVGPLTNKSLICNTIDQFNSLISKESISFDEKWKRVALGYLKSVPFLLQLYPTVSISTKEDAKEVLLQGIKSDVQNAIKELHDSVSSVHVEHIPLDSLVIKLLLSPEASSLLSAILESQQLDVSWTIDGDNLIVISKETISVGSVKQLLAENFVSAGFLAESVGTIADKNVEGICNVVQRNENSFVVVEKERSGFRVASTKAIMRSLLQQEHSLNNMVDEYVQVNDINDEVEELHKELNSVAATLKSVKKENTKNQREKEVLQTDVEALMKENKNLKGQIERLLSQPKETQLQQLPYTSTQSLVDIPSACRISAFDLDGTFRNSQNSFSKTVSSGTFKREFRTKHGLKVCVVADDITTMIVDGVICPQDDFCRSYGRIAKAIAKVSNEKYRSDTNRITSINKCEVKEVLAFPKTLPFKYVLHTNTPRWDKDAVKNCQKFLKELELTIRNILRHCSDSRGIETAAVPVLGIGADGHDTPYLTFAASVVKQITQEAELGRLKIKELFIVPSEYSMASAIADTFDKESIFTPVTSFSRTRKGQGKKEEKSPIQSSEASSKGESQAAKSPKKLGSTVRGGNADDCVICMDAPNDPRQLKCGHVFCQECIGKQLKLNNSKCPTCGSIEGILTGNQPPGRMSVTREMYSLTGYPQCGRIVVTYHIYSGTQGPEHKTPGKHFEGISRSGYLPDNDKGQLVAKLLRVAFDRKLVFTIGDSRTTGKTDVVTWNDIHHKTNPKPYTSNQFGYPDPTYLDRVLEELADKGVTEADIKPGTPIY